MAKYREIVYDLLKDLKQTYDDSSIVEYSVLWWVSMVANKFLKQHLDNEQGRTGQMPGRFLTVFPETKLLTSSFSHKRKYIQLPGVLLDMDYDRSIAYITYNVQDELIPGFTQVKFSMITPAHAHLLQASHETPTPTNPYGYVVADQIFTLGLEAVDVPEVEMGLYLAIDPRKVNDMDAECPLPEHLVSQMKYEIINLGRFVMSVPADKVNDGNDTIQVAPPKQITNEQ